MDIFNELGELGFASRLKRLSDNLLGDVSQIYSKLNLDFNSRWFTVLYTLNKKSPLSITDLADSLNISHTAVNQISSEMIKNNLLLSKQDVEDGRRRLLSISQRGIEVVTILSPIWDRIKESTQELINSVDPDLIAKIDQIEKELRKKSIYKQVWKKLYGEPKELFEIVEYRPAYKKHFYYLNKEWIEDYFEIEKQDLKILNDPNQKIIKKGGIIYFAKINNRIIGTCALIPYRKKYYEIGKLAVTISARGRGIARALVGTTIHYAKSKGIKILFVRTNKKLKEANNLYTSLGFINSNNSPFPEDDYSRPTFTMDLKID